MDITYLSFVDWLKIVKHISIVEYVQLPETLQSKLETEYRNQLKGR